MCRKRLTLLNESFDRIDRDQDGLLNYSDLKEWYKTKVPLFKKMKKVNIDAAIERDLIPWMQKFNNNSTKITDPTHTKPITRDKFINYYFVISSTIINDSYFDLFIRDLFNL
jgi:hypothetical protein